MAVRCEHAVKAREVHARPGHERGQAGEEVERLASTTSVVPSRQRAREARAARADRRRRGALGSTRSHAERLERLARLGLAPEAIARISAPVGLDIGSRTAAEITVSIAAEPVRARAYLRDTH